MTINETLPLCPDTELTTGDPVAYSEPIEVGPFSQGVVFVSVTELHECTVRTEVGISPSGYEDWDAHWTSLDLDTTLTRSGMHAIRIHNFGNWLRLRFELEDQTREAAATVLGWFSGDG